jgi:ribosomal protein S27AE
MIVMIADQQILSAKQVCQNCLMADHAGLPRWHGEQLRCGQALKKSTSRQATIYRCQMGFNVTQVN